MLPADNELTDGCQLRSDVMLPADNELTDGCQLRPDVSAAPDYHTTLGKEYSISTLSLSSEKC